MLGAAACARRAATPASAIAEDGDLSTAAPSIIAACAHLRRQPAPGEVLSVGCRARTDHASTGESDVYSYDGERDDAQGRRASAVRLFEVRWQE